MMNEFMGDTTGGGSVQIPFPVRNLTAEVAEDFTLPDYQPEIKRLLRIGVNLLPPSCTSGGNGTEITGTMDYFVLYVGQDGGIYCAPLSTQYRLEAEPDWDAAELSAAASEPMTCICDLSSEVPVGRVTAPRRLHIRCKVKARMSLYGECPLRVEGSEGDPTVETLSSTARVGRLYRGMGEPLVLQDDVILAPADGEMRVVCAEGQVMMTEASAASGEVHCRGEVTVKLTLCPAESILAFAEDSRESFSPPELTLLHRKIPFNHSVEAEGVTPDCSAMACGYCTEISVLMEEGHLHVDLGVVCEVRAQKNETVSYIKDIYSTRYEGTCRYIDYPTQRSLRALNSNFTLSDSLPLSEVGVDPTARVVDVSATAIPEELVSDPGKLRSVLTGKCRCHLLLLRDGEYTAADMELPFRYEFDDQALLRGEEIPKGSTDITLFDGNVTVVNCRARMDGERVGVDAELAVAIRSHSPAPFTALTDFIPGEEVTRRRGEYVVCFPAPADTVWSVAKRYHAPMAALTAANNLPGSGVPDRKDSLEGIGYLIV
ncbi:MAG: LysM peptidoglycan-binding domain-containing protein [Clostridia bacterium]|nr:LysM peptidoglycan-binding domain-containing protein [Clostridia bacterium]